MHNTYKNNWCVCLVSRCIIRDKLEIIDLQESLTTTGCSLKIVLFSQFTTTHPLHVEEQLICARHQRWELIKFQEKKKENTLSTKKKSKKPRSRPRNCLHPSELEKNGSTVCYREIMYFNVQIWNNVIEVLLISQM